MGLREFARKGIWEKQGPVDSFPHIRITAGAFPDETERQLARYRYEAAQVDDPLLSRLLRFAALCVLESVSYTRKDGQYLRWDYRSGRTAGTKPFDKGPILPFSDAIRAKLQEIASDLCEMDPANTGLRNLFDTPTEITPGEIELRQGSCLKILAELPEGSFDAIVTSPPYANRYDYTRTYALELAMLGVGEEQIRELRQTMLSCTVENREKTGLSEVFSSELYNAAQTAFQSQELLQLVLAYLEECRESGALNNTGIPRMLRGYFWEMCLVIFACARMLKPGSPFVMVNDNARYQGAHIPVDLILSVFAHSAGFTVEKIWVLPTGKGNSSQQMGEHGREELRKCVYVWRRLHHGIR